jgi:hypothetical protein
MPTIEQIHSTGITFPQAIAAELTRRQIRTSRGGTQWQATQVNRLLERV